ncbi:hypothetical protein JKP88DRAFT_273025 [Tribonema minus]|uniref:Uncharacterized protein n=1 Tax=Tribonema minus TaxID=303371 RepID=A0A836CEV2_9STRA|nr:hypothetical protein JKP88DRAFT_273025 [Tribonema minus]
MTQVQDALIWEQQMLRAPLDPDEATDLHVWKEVVGDSACVAGEDLLAQALHLLNIRDHRANDTAYRIRMLGLHGASASACPGLGGTVREYARALASALCNCRLLSHLLPSMTRPISIKTDAKTITVGSLGAVLARAMIFAESNLTILIADQCDSDAAIADPLLHPPALWFMLGEELRLLAETARAGHGKAQGEQSARDATFSSFNKLTAIAVCLSLPPCASSGFLSAAVAQWQRRCAGEAPGF